MIQDNDQYIFTLDDEGIQNVAKGVTGSDDLDHDTCEQVAYAVESAFDALVETAVRKVACKMSNDTCPVCGSTATERDSTYVDDDEIRDVCFCYECDSKWTNTYYLGTQTIIHVGKGVLGKDWPVDANGVPIEIGDTVVLVNGDWR